MKHDQANPTSQDNAAHHGELNGTDDAVRRLREALDTGDFDGVLNLLFSVPWQQLQPDLHSALVRDTAGELEQELKRLASFPSKNPNPIVELNCEGEVTYLNDAARKSFPELSRVGIKHPLLVELQPMLQSFADGKQHSQFWEAEIGKSLYHQKAICLPEHKTVRVYCCDVTDLQKKVHRLEGHSRQDALTGLYNRAEFELQLSQLLFNLQTYNKHHVLICLDLDQFKIVKERCGDVAGDELLKQVGQILQKNVRSSDVLARLGGAEFALLLSNCPVDKATETAEKLRMLLEAYRFHWQDHSFDITASLGLVVLGDKQSNANDIINAADIACYIARDQGGNRVHLYDNDDAKRAGKKGRIEWGSRLRKALHEQGFELYRQQIKSLASEDKEPFYEILLRYRDSKGVLMLPDSFLQEAERYDLSSHIDRWVVKQVFRYIMEQEMQDTRFTINLSARSLSNWHFLNYLVDQFHETGVSPDQVCFDIVESVAIANMTYGTRFITALRNMGCRFALDNFGSGLTSFEYLKTLAVDYVKIHGGYIKTMMKDEMSATMVESINQISHAMGLETIAEKVEDDSTIQRLQEIGVDYAQGYIFGALEPLDSL